MAYLDPSYVHGQAYVQPPGLASSLILHYQPIVRSADNSVAAVEALVRFPRPDGSLRPTMPMLRQIYASHLGRAFDRRIITAAVAENMHWIEQGIDVAVHVNVSPTTIASLPGDAFGEWIASHCSAAPRLTIEVTERDSFLAATRATDFVASCRRRGIEVAIDDFGCGYATFELLLDLCADVVKIDCAFTARVPTCSRTKKILLSLIALAHELDMRVVAEGVETSEQCSWLRRAGCDELQGFYFARPMPAHAYVAWHHDHR